MMPMPPKRPREQELDKEIAFHLDQLIEANIARGLSPAGARRQALLDFGGPTQVKQSVREIHLSPLLDAARFHLRAVLRFLRHASEPTAPSSPCWTPSFCARCPTRPATSSS